VIKVHKKGEREFLVIVDEKNSRTEHNVELDDEYYQRLTRGKITKEELVKESFEFLLDREPKESILSRFNLKVIEKYFPEFGK